MNRNINKFDASTIGEIVVIGFKEVSNEAFISAVCNDMQKDNEVIFGRLPIDSHLTLHIYGLNITGEISNFDLDMVAQKIIGYIILYDWNDLNSLERAKDIVQYLYEKWTAPCLIAANVGNNDFPVSTHVFQNGISLSPSIKFTFFSQSDIDSIKDVYTALLDKVIS